MLCLQEEIADRTLKMLRGAIAELQVGDPRLLATDVVPVTCPSVAAEQFLKALAESLPPDK